MESTLTTSGSSEGSPIGGPEPVPGALLTTVGLGARYGVSVVLHGIDLHVMPGEIVAILGANGAGKTTLLSSIMGLVI